MKGGLFALSLMLCFTLNAQNIADFTSIPTGGQDAQLKIPSTHEFQFLARENAPSELINNGYDYPGEFDFTAYVPK